MKVEVKWKKKNVGVPQVKAAREVTRGRGAENEEEGYAGDVGGLPEVRGGSFCACQNLTVCRNLCNASPLNLPASPLITLHFISGPSPSFLPLSLLLVIIHIECTEVPGSSICWNYLPVLAAGGVCVCVN